MLGIGIFLASVLAAPCLAHDIPNERIDRAIQVVLSPGQLDIDYEVSLAELTLVRDLRRLSEHTSNSDPEVLYRQYGDIVGPLNAKGFLITLDGRELELTCEGFDLQIEGHPRFRFRLRAPLPRSGRLRIRDANYTSSEGTSRIAMHVEPPLSATGFQGAEWVGQVPARPVWMLSDEEEADTRQLAVNFSTKGPVPVATIVRSPPPRVSTSAPTRAVGRLADLLKRGKASTWLVCWLVALGLGAAHSVQPGHGKTLVAAASLGSGLGWRGGIVLALATTVAHFASVCGVAIALWLLPSVRYAAIQSTLVGITGLLLAVMGFWRVGRYLAPDVEVDPVPIGFVDLKNQNLLMLGLAGGIVPCWDAILLLAVAELAGMLGFGIFLLSGFSLGMAAVLVAVGLAAGRVRGWFSGRAQARRWERRLGLASGLLLAGLGCLLLLSGR